MSNINSGRIPLPTNAHLGRVALASTLADLVKHTHPYNGVAFQAVCALQMVSLPEHNGYMVISTTLTGVSISHTDFNHDKEAARTRTVWITAVDEGISEGRWPASSRPKPRHLDDIILEGLDWIHYTLEGAD